MKLMMKTIFGKSLILIIIISIGTLFIQFYDSVFLPLFGKNDIISLIGGKLNFIPIALSAFLWGSGGGLLASIIFSFLAVFNFALQSSIGANIYILAAQVISYILAGFVIGSFANAESKKTTIPDNQGEENEHSEQIKTLERLASTVANDIKHPLNIMRTVISNLEKSICDEENREYINALSKEVDRLNGIVADYLDFAAPRVTHTDRVNVPSILVEVVSRVRPQAERVGVRLVYNSEPIDGFTLGDKDRLSRMFLNLLINGLQASEGGAQVEVKCIKNRDSQKLIIEVSDTGVGISDEVIGKIFDPFFTTRKRGSGLGLSITKAIAEEHSGTITAENTYPSGAKFTITLPVNDKTVN